MAGKSSYSLAYLIVYFIFALIEILLMSGITYGWVSISSVFKKRGFFGELCNRFNRTAKSGVKRNDGHSCLAQEKQLNLVFNVAVSLLCASKLFIGIFTDKFGPRCSQIFGG